MGPRNPADKLGIIGFNLNWPSELAGPRERTDDPRAAKRAGDGARERIPRNPVVSSADSTVALEKIKAEEGCGGLVHGSWGRARRREPFDK